MTRKYTARTSGFTIPEMLAVIAIIVIIVSILLPAFGQSRKVARQAICASNLHQQGVAMRGYLTDYSYFPGHAAWLGTSNRPTAVWAPRMRRYTNDDHGVFNDPSSPEGFDWRKVTGTPGGMYARAEEKAWGYEEGDLLLDVFTVPFSYAYNDWGRWNIQTNPQRGLGADLKGGITTPHLRKTGVVAPSNMIAITEATQDGSWDFNADPTNPREYPGKFHFEGTNVLFVDAHVKWFLQSELVDVNTNTEAGRTMSRKWNNHNKYTRDTE